MYSYHSFLFHLAARHRKSPGPEVCAARRAAATLAADPEDGASEPARLRSRRRVAAQARAVAKRRDDDGRDRPGERLQDVPTRRLQRTPARRSRAFRHPARAGTQLT